MFDYSYNISGLNSAAKYPYQDKTNLSTNSFSQSSIFDHQYPVDEYEDINAIIANFWNNVYAQMASFGQVSNVRTRNKPTSVEVKKNLAKLHEEFNELRRRTGINFKIISDYRDDETQRKLYNKYLAGKGNYAAPPGHSEHGNGNAGDIDRSNLTPEDVKRLGREWTKMGYTWGGLWKNDNLNKRKNEPWHFDMRPCKVNTTNNIA